MPWTIKDVDEHKQGLDDKQKEQWVAVANSAHQKCMDDGGKEEMCAMHAIKQANGIVGGSRKTMGGEEEFHLPGQHDQSTHGRGNTRPPGYEKRGGAGNDTGVSDQVWEREAGKWGDAGGWGSVSPDKGLLSGDHVRINKAVGGGKGRIVAVKGSYLVVVDKKGQTKSVSESDVELFSMDNEEELFNIDGVEIFRTGTWRGDKYTTIDLQHMVDSFNEFKSKWFRPAIKDGHHTDKGKPALGYMENVRIQGEKLLADLVELPKKVYDAIKTKRYDRVSVEMYHNMQREGKTYPKVLTALAILGVEVPEVSGLKPLRECFEDQQGTLVAYEIEFEQKSESDSDNNKKKEDLEMKPEELEAVKKEYETKMEAMSNQLNDLQGKLKEYEKKQTPAEVKTLVTQLSETQQKFSEMSAKLDEMQKKNLSLEEARRKDRIQQKVDSLKVPAFRFYAQQFYDWATTDAEVKIVKYSIDGITKEATAEQIVDQFCAQLNKATDNLLIQHSKVDVFKRDDAPADDNPRVEADRRIKSYMAEHPEADYSSAMTKVFEADGDLKLAYARS